MYNQKFLIHKFTHFFVVYLRDLRFKNLVYEFTGQFVDYVQKYNPTTRRSENYPRVWAGRLQDNSSFRFPIGVLQKFEDFLRVRNVHRDEISYKEEISYVPATAKFKLNENFIPRDYQVEALDYTLQHMRAGAPSVLISMPPGSGKTVAMGRFLEIMQLRAAMMISPTYIDKWIADAKSYLCLDDEDIYEVAGSKSIRRAVEMVEADDFNRMFSIISVRTFSEFMKAYEENPRSAISLYGTDPISFWQMLRIGVLGGDEVHEQFFAFHWIHTAIHGPFHLGLSATMLDIDPFIEERQRSIYPSAIRFDKIKMKRYIVMINIDYHFENFERDRIRSNYPRNKNYNQNAFEDSIVRNKRVLKNYLDMVGWAVDTFFFHRTHQSPDKLGIYFSSVAMLNIVVAYLKDRYPDVDIRRFVGEDPYINLIDPKIRCTTQGSGGTGKDIKNLTTVLNFNSMRTHKGNIQLLGRIREIEGRDDLYFVQFNCSNIRKHRQFKQERDKLLKPMTKSISTKLYGPAI